MFKNRIGSERINDSIPFIIYFEENSMLIYLTIIDSSEDKRKFEKIYIGYKQTMYYAANRILKDTYAAEDAVHQAFLRIIDRLEKIDENDRHKTKAFLVVIVENIAIDIYRKRKRDNIFSFDELELYIADEFLHNQDEKDEVSCAIERLPINYSTVLRLKYSQGYSDAEIATFLGITDENVRKRISRAKKKLRQLLGGEGVAK